MVPTVQIQQNKVIVKPGFGRRTSNPLSTRSSASTAGAGQTTTPAPVKTVAEKNIKNAEVSTEFRTTGGKTSGSGTTLYPSSPYVKGTSFSEDIKTLNNRTTVMAGGYNSSPRSVDRAVRRYEQAMERAQQNAKQNAYSNFNPMMGGMGSFASAGSGAVLTSAMGMLNKAFASDTPAAGAAKAVTKAVTAPQGSAAALISSLSTAEYSKALTDGLNSVSDKIASNTESISNAKTEKTELQTQLGEYENKSAELGQQSQQIGQDIRSLEALITTASAKAVNGEEPTVNFKGKEMTIAQAKAEIAELKAQKAKIDNEKKTLDETTIPQTKKDITAKEETIEKLTSENTELNEAKTKYEANKTKMEAKEKGEMDKLYKKITDIADKLKTEKNENKKAKLIQQYKSFATQFNAYIDNTTANHSYSKVSDEPVLADPKSAIDKMEASLS